MDDALVEKYADKIYSAVLGTPTRNRSAFVIKQLISAQLVQMMLEAKEE